MSCRVGKGYHGKGCPERMSCSEKQGYSVRRRKVVTGHAVREGDVMWGRRDEVYKAACFHVSRSVIYQRL
jgi:hypothetical protein